jgi:hypothetical protein
VSSRAALALVLALSIPSLARAEDPAGAVAASALIAGSDYGAAATADLWIPTGVFRIGGALGLAAISSDDADRSRVFLPFGASLAVALRSGEIGGRFILRGGGWAGAINQGIAAGGWVSGAAYLDYWFSENVSIAIGLDVWGLLGHGDRVAFLPGISVAWLPLS